MDNIANLVLNRAELAKLVRAHRLITVQINQIYRDIHNTAEDRLAYVARTCLSLDKYCPDPPPTSSSSLPTYSEEHTPSPHSTI